jgi:30S ribosomal protein S2
VDTNSDPTPVDYIIPANDDSTAAVEVIISAVCAAISEGLQERKAEGKGDDKDENEEGAKRIEHGRSRNGGARRPRKAVATPAETTEEA